MKKIALVLGGGGLRGMSHIGVLKSLHKRGIKISEYIGSSMGALIASFAASGIPIRFIEKVAKNLKKSDILDFNPFDFLKYRLKTGWIYRGDKLETFLRNNLPVHTFDELKTPLYVNTVNLNTGGTVIWGLPSFRDVSLEEAVYSSCAFPIVFKPKKIKGEYYIDGGVADNLPIRITRFTRPDIIIAVNLRYRGVLKGKHLEQKGMISLLDQTNTIVGQVMTEHNLQLHNDLKVIYIHPKVEEYGFLDFDHTEELIDEGERATNEVLDGNKLFGSKENGRHIFGLFYKRKPVFNVNNDLCTGCGHCIISCPVNLYKTINGKSKYQFHHREKCTSCLQCIKNCPYGAISFEGEDKGFALHKLSNFFKKD
ncbi:MAG: patatin-like phospholipase family protein [Spirochaetota bacterium]|nr:patatin-like phospholipase family protein [Spirochaetota bacterium]